MPSGEQSAGAVENRPEVVAAGTAQELGIDVEMLERDRPSLPIVFMSGYSDDILAKHGAVDPERVLLKPFSPEQLIAYVQKALNGSVAAA